MSRDELPAETVESLRERNHKKDMAIMAAAYSPAEFDEHGRLVKQARLMAHQQFSPIAKRESLSSRAEAGRGGVKLARRVGPLSGNRFARRAQQKADRRDA
jgi:hypothetical protein